HSTLVLHYTTFLTQFRTWVLHTHTRVAPMSHLLRISTTVPDMYQSSLTTPMRTRPWRHTTGMAKSWKSRYLIPCNDILFSYLIFLRVKSSSTPRFGSLIKMNDSSGNIGKLDRTEAEHIGHLSTNLVLSRYVAHQ